MGLTFSFLICALFIAGAIPLILQIVPPNRHYGLKTRETLSNKEVWYRENKKFGYIMAIFSIISLAEVLLTYWILCLFPQVFLLFKNVLYLFLVLLVPNGIIILICFAYIKRFIYPETRNHREFLLMKTQSSEENKMEEK
jgi:uncharacterized membrane protein